MNCSDISLILDDCDIGKLEDEPREAVKAHVATCSDCARGWKLHTRLVARKLPALPSDLIADCIALAEAGPAVTLPRRKWSRIALTASVVVLVAAAATLMVYRTFSPGKEAPIAPFGGTDREQSRTWANTASPISSQEALHAEANISSAPASQNASNTFSVRLLTFQDDTLNAVDMSDFAIFRAAVISELHRTPGLILVLTESSTPGQATDFEITLSAIRRNGRLIGRLDVSKSGPNRVVMRIRGTFGQDCDAPFCQAAANLGESMSRTAAMLMMPPDAASPPALLQQLQDSSLTSQQRLDALRRLDQRNLGVRRAGLRTDPSGDSLRDPAVIRAVIDLASVAPSPEQRAEIWRTMRSIKSPALIEPLARAAQMDPDISVRTEAVATLVADYARDPRSRTALELVARMDSHPMLRAVANRGLSGEATWKSYVISSLEDTTLSDVQRLEAVLFHVRSSDISDQPLADLLDDDAIKALAQVLPRAASTGTDIYGVPKLLTQLASVKHPAVTSMLLTSLERRDPRFDRRLVMNMLADRVEEPDVRAALETIAKVDPDEQSRQIATKALHENE